MLVEEGMEHMTCRICTELERMIQSAREPDHPDHLAGLSEAGERNRNHQHAEKILKAELDLKRHKKSFHPAEIEP
jgi:hypothetical protein